MPLTDGLKKLNDTIESIENALIIAQIRALPKNSVALNLSDRPLISLAGVKLPVGLQRLDLSYTKLTCLDGVTLPAGLQKLFLYGTNLTSLNGVTLPVNLQKLSLGNTNLESLDGVTLPAGLQELWLYNTNLTRLPESLRELKKLRTLDLSGLCLEELPDWLPELGLPFSRQEYGVGIRLYETIVDGVDMSIFNRSQESIKEWFREYSARKRPIGTEPSISCIPAESDTPLNEVKVVFLGDGEAGKSHTIARLLDDGRAIPEFREGSTPGIVISDKVYPIGNREITVHFWDFGGQEILHSMHRMFLTERTLYVVVLNVREGNQDERARYWLHNLRSFANGAPALLVLNKMDMNKNASVNEADLRELYPGLTSIVKISALEDADDDFQSNLIDVLREQLGGMEITKLPLTAAGLRLKNRLQSMEQSYILGDVFGQYCDACGVSDNSNIRRDLLNTFGELGISFFYRGSMELEKHVVLKPAWITNAVYTILFNKIHAVTNGLVSHDTIYEMLSSSDTKTVRRTVADATYSRDEVDYVLEVFRKFRLSFRVDEDTEFLPMLCDANTANDAVYYENAPNALEFRMHYEYLPSNVIHHLMVERRKELDRSNVWLTGARFVCGDTGRSAVVKSEGNLIRILVRADKEPRDPQRYLDELKESLERINAIMGLTVSNMEVVYKENGITECFGYQWLLLNQQHGVPQILSMKHNKWIRLVDVLLQSDFPEDEKQKKLMEDIRQACEKLQSRMIYWNASEDVRTDYLMDMLDQSGYFVRGQHRTGISAGGIQSGELDLDIRLTPGDAWSALEALNLKGSSPSQIEYWNAHLKKLLGNYNDVGRSFLFHVSYVECTKDRFFRVFNELYEHLRFYSPPGFELMSRFVRHLPLTNESRSQENFLRAVKCVYDCGGIPMIVYHFFVRIGE